ncbi:hypothetical protein AG1IA_08348 [Rhizoctonia solani AG-1 IA]|uniref:Uncharacterized protein n=1 Tax=Thanatephorus cucumeris (strain AG1-IA) TaxID=983506 RepID=L8WHC5_THACA|nr:hypothetical protein AG1IA_08348 [Rhizoctonia solani AG-1 IA]
MIDFGLIYIYSAHGFHTSWKYPSSPSIISLNFPQYKTNNRLSDQ